MRLGEFAHLPRLIDKARAVIAGSNGEYHYDTMMDRFFFAFTGIEPADFLAAVKAGESDSSVLVWVTAHLKPPRTSVEITQWTAWLLALGPTTAERHAFLAEKITKNGPQRADIQTWCDHLDLDDYVSFGGRG